MSLAIDPGSVVAILLADGWHPVKRGTFDLDAYEFIQPGSTGNDDFIMHGGGQSGVCAVGFTVTEVEYTDGAIQSDRGQLSGPLTSILAVFHK